MSIKETYSDFLIEKYIKDKLKNGETLSAIDLFAEAKALNENKDLENPQLSVSTYKVVDGEEASANKMNETFEVIEEDLKIVFKELFNLSKNELQLYERWKVESENIEKKLINLEEEVENLLLLTQDTEGYHATIVDNFTDLNSLDIAETSVNINTDTSNVSLSDSISSSSRLHLGNVLNEEDITFRVRSNVISRSDLSGSSIKNIFSQKSEVWHTVIRTEKMKPVVCELIVKLGETEVEVNNIRLLLHDSGHSSNLNVTGLYSTDDVTYTVLPCEDYSQNMTRGGNFSCNSFSAKYIKFILSKETPDRTEGDKFNYQFGFREIIFFFKSFGVGSANKQKFESNWLFATKEDGSIVEFEKAVLEACEIVPTNTLINYFIAAANNTSSAVNWMKITPTNRIGNGDYNPDLSVFEVGKTLDQEIKDIIRYDPSSSNAFYKYIDSSTSLLGDGGTLTSENELYSYLNSGNDVILNCLLYNEDFGSKNLVNINELTLKLFRGVGDWLKEDSKYKCVVEVLNLNGVEVSLGKNSLLLGDKSQNNDITIPKGIHKIEIDESDFGALQSIIENKVDSFAAIEMEKVGIFDMLSNVNKTNHKKFALDLSLLGKNSSVDTTVKRAFLIKSDLPKYNTVTNASNEKFKIKFNLINQLMKYVKVKGELETEDSSVTPSCDAYQVKLG